MSKLDTVIATLNGLDVGSLDRIASQLQIVKEVLENEGLPELVDTTVACHQALMSGDLVEFRRLRETLVSRLGHVRVKTE